LLAKNVHDIRESLKYLKSEMKAAGELKPGEYVPPLQVNDIEGNPFSVEYTADAPATVIYVFTPDCIWCTRNAENIKALASQAGTGYRFIGLSLSKKNLKEYVSQQGFTFPVYTEVKAEIGDAYKLAGTPRTIVISNEGKIIKSWFGAYINDTEKEVESFFNIALPGIVEADKKDGKKGCLDCGGETSPKP
jgi:peroxiredoxin